MPMAHAFLQPVEFHAVMLSIPWCHGCGLAPLDAMVLALLVSYYTAELIHCAVQPASQHRVLYSSI